MTECVACLDPQNYAAVALKLQETATHAEQCIFALETSLRQATNPQTIYASVAAVPLVNANTVFVLGIGNTTIYSNSMLTQFYTASQWTQGVWQVGYYLNATASGAVTDNSIRELSVAVKDADITLNPTTMPFPGYSQLSTVTMTEPNSGSGVDMTISAVVVLDKPEQQPVFIFRHANVASALTLSATSLMWATRLGDTTTLRVV